MTQTGPIYRADQPWQWPQQFHDHLHQSMYHSWEHKLTLCNLERSSETCCISTFLRVSLSHGDSRFLRISTDFVGSSILKISTGFVGSYIFIRQSSSSHWLMNCFCWMWFCASTCYSAVEVLLNCWLCDNQIPTQTSRCLCWCCYFRCFMLQVWIIVML